MSLESRFAARLVALGVTRCRVLVAVSGGSDSLALLLLTARVATELELEPIVAHADHGLQPGSGEVAARVAARAASLGIDGIVGRLHLPSGSGETEARRARHAWLRAIRTERGARWILLAHQRDDQAETVLMRFLAGSGPAGLAGMAPIRGPFVRPLLDVGREELIAYRTGAGWDAWDDPANADRRHVRGWLRHDLLPVLTARDPAVVTRIVRAASQAAAARAAWDAVLEALPGLTPTVDRSVVSVAAPPLAGYDSGLARAMVQALGRRAGAVVGPRAAARVERMVRGGRSGAWVPIGHGWRAELAFGRLRLVPPSEAGAPEQVAIGGAEGVARFGAWALRWTIGPAPDRLSRDGWAGWFIPGAWEARVPRPGDRIHPLGGVGSRPVVQCLQEARVARSERAGWPLLVEPGTGTVLWIPGICRAEAQLPPPGSEAMRIDVEHR